MRRKHFSQEIFTNPLDFLQNNQIRTHIQIQSIIKIHAACAQTKCGCVSNGFLLLRVASFNRWFWLVLTYISPMISNVFGALLVLSTFYEYKFDSNIRSIFRCRSYFYSSCCVCCVYGWFFFLRLFFSFFLVFAVQLWMLMKLSKNSS